VQHLVALQVKAPAPAAETNTDIGLLGQQIFSRLNEGRASSVSSSLSPATTMYSSQMESAERIASIKG
jgi:hypothetical protein